MKMSSKTFLYLLNNGIDTTWVHLMLMMKDKDPGLEEIMKNLRMRGVVNLLVGKGYITTEGFLSEDAEKLLSELEDLEPPASIPKTVMEVAVEGKGVFDKWSNRLLINLQEELARHTGKVQVMGFGRKYFIPDLEDMRGALVRFFKKYKKEKDYVKIEKILLRHVEKCAREKSFSPCIQYFIIHQDRGSQLAAAMDSFVEDERVTMQGDNPINPNVEI